MQNNFSNFAIDKYVNPHPPCYEEPYILLVSFY